MKAYVFAHLISKISFPLEFFTLSYDVKETIQSKVVTYGNAQKYIIYFNTFIYTTFPSCNNKRMPREKNSLEFNEQKHKLAPTIFSLCLY